MADLTPAARTACWLGAWISGRVSADDTIDALGDQGRAEPTTAAEFIGPQPGERRTPASFLSELRAAGSRGVVLALPVPGELLGLGGPPAFNAEAIEVGEAVIVVGAGIGLVPTVTSSVVGWRVLDADPPGYLPDISSAGRNLRLTLIEAAHRLAELDVADWRPELADELVSVRRSDRTVGALPFASAEAARLAADATRALSIVELAVGGHHGDSGGAVSAAEATQRSAALGPLATSARTAIIASVSTQSAG